jgi:hypothetical protein
MKKLLPLIFIFCASCKKDVLVISAGDPFNSIQNTNTITIPNYSYLSDSLGTTVTVLGDVEANQMKEVFGPDLPVPIPYNDTLSADFQVLWLPVKAKFIAAAVFKKEPDIKTIEGNGINNSADCVWLWNNGMGTGTTNQIGFDDGKSISGIVNGEPAYSNELVPLTKGKTYYLMMWAWNDDATKIEFSSKLIRIVIKAP